MIVICLHQCTSLSLYIDAHETIVLCLQRPTTRYMSFQRTCNLTDSPHHRNLFAPIYLVICLHRHTQNYRSLSTTTHDTIHLFPEDFLPHICHLFAPMYLVICLHRRTRNYRSLSTTSYNVICMYRDTQPEDEPNNHTLQHSTPQYPRTR